jgi:hypothetical protein
MMKKFGLILSVAVLLALSAAMTQASLVSLYTFDDSADLAVNAVNTAFNGTANNSPTAASTAAVGGAIHFVGGTTTATNQYLGVPNGAPPCNFGNSGTFSLWLKGDWGTGQGIGADNIMGCGQALYLNSTGYGNGTFGPTIYAGNSDGGSGNMDSWIPTTNVWPDNTNWHLVTMTWGYDQVTSAGRVQTYIDGSAVPMMKQTLWAGDYSWTSASSFGSAISWYSSSTINGNGGEKGHTGDMDDFSAWNEELNSTKAKALYSMAAGTALKYNAKDTEALFNLYVNGGSAVIGGQTWNKYGSGTAFDGTGVLTGTDLALGLTSGVKIGTPVIDATWTGTLGTAWGTPANWNPAGPATGVATFNDTATGSLTADISAADVSPASVVFNNSTLAYVVSGSKGIVGSATVLKQGTAKVTISTVNSYSGVTTIETTGGTLQFNKAAAWNPVVNLGGANIKAGKMIFDYTGEGSPAATIGALLKTSYNSASSTHFNTGKFQSATADTHHALGWKDSANQVTVAYTLYGDATVNGAVDISDLSALGQNWNGAGKVWAQGDFNYDGNVDISDLSALGQHWNQSIAGFSGGEGGAIVPEPSTLALLAAGLVGLLAYVWRKRK